MVMVLATSWTIHPFALGPKIYDFRSPSHLETQWIINRFHATAVTYSWPDMIIETSSPPNPIALTVASVAALFVPPGFKPRHLGVSSNIANPRIPDGDRYLRTDPVKMQDWQLFENLAARFRMLKSLSVDEGQRVGLSQIHYGATRSGPDLEFINRQSRSSIVICSTFTASRKFAQALKILRGVSGEG